MKRLESAQQNRCTIHQWPRYTYERMRSGVCVVAIARCAFLLFALFERNLLESN